MSNKKSDYVIIRAFKDEPVKLIAVGFRESAVDAIGSDPSMPMPFHLERAYRFNESMFKDMRAAFEAGQSDKLKSLWARASLLPRHRRTA
jgi:hypothetical protein